MAQDGIDDDSGGLFNISISDSEGEDGGIDTSHGIASSSKKEHRTGQSEEAFRAVKSGYRAKVENGEVSQRASSSDIRCGAFGFAILICERPGNRTSHTHFYRYGSRWMSRSAVAGC